MLTTFSVNKLISSSKIDRINRLNLIYFQLSDYNYKRKHMRLQNIKKFNCPVQVILKEYVEFLDFKVIL